MFGAVRLPKPVKDASSLLESCRELSPWPYDHQLLKGDGGVSLLSALKNGNLAVQWRPPGFTLICFEGYITRTFRLLLEGTRQ